MGEEKKCCDFCGGEHGDLCPEFKDVASVTGDFKAMMDVERNWKCAGCGCVERSTAFQLIEKGWVFSSKNDVTWADCPRCGESSRGNLQKDVEDWLSRGGPRGDN